MSEENQEVKKNQDQKELAPEELKQVSGGASDIFAKLGDIKGESMDDKHKDEIEVLSYSWGVTNQTRK
jgi:hypothetical protein